MRHAARISSAANATLEDLCNSLFDVIFQNLLYTKSVVLINAGEDDQPSVPNADKPLQLISQRGAELDKYAAPLSPPLPL
jgi:hypothetical protein